MKYIGESTPAWTISKKRVGEDKIDKINPEQYDWHLGIDYLSHRTPDIKLYPYAKTTLFEESAQKIKREQTESPAKTNIKKFSFVKKDEEVKPTNQIHSQFSTKLGFFTKTNKFKGFKPVTSVDVGPLTYEIKEPRGKETSMAYKTDNDIAILPADIIGPGVYDPRYSEIDRYKGSVKFINPQERTMPRIRPRSESPGPGYYESAALANDEQFHSKKGTFSNYKRPDLNLKSCSGSLGPGSYNNIINSIEGNLRTKHKKGLLKSGPPKEIALKNNGVPGPDKYEVSKQKTKFEGGLMPKAGRDKIKIIEKDNDEQIELSKFKIRSHSAPRKVRKLAPGFTTFGKAERNRLSKPKINLPGPSDYQTGIPKRSVSVSIGKGLKYIAVANIMTPGPGHYDLTINDDFNVNKSKWKGVKYHDKHLAQGINSKPYPGPQDYNIIYTQVDPHEDILGTLMTRQAKKFTWQSGDPEIDTAPGLYDIRSTIPQLPPFETPEAKERGIRGLFN